MSGSEKLPILAIGKSKKPRSFKNKKIPVEYKANLKAWMTAKIFEEFLNAWDERLGKQRRSVLLCLDNFSGHPSNLQLKNIKMIFFPPNTTANSQPMDQGIIENLKRNYKKVLLRRRLESMDMGKEFNFTLLDALHLIHCAWNQVSESTIKNCFGKANFYEKVQIEEDSDDSELISVWEKLPSEEKMNENEVIELSDFIEADERLEIGGSFSLEEIAKDLCSEKNAESDDGHKEKVVSFNEAYQDWCIVRKFVQERCTDLSVMRASDCIENEMSKLCRKNLRQLTIAQSLYK
jgi:hypothetical protein